MISYPSIDVVFPGQFPADFVNFFPGWGCFDRQTIEENKGKLLMLDFDLGKDCRFRCKNCFRRSPGFEHVSANELTWEEVVAMVLEAKQLGLQAIKILGAGEPFQNPRFLEFLRFADSQGVHVSVFTRGNVIGNDEECVQYNSHYGITTGRQLAEELYNLKVSIIVSFNSRDDKLQNDYVGASDCTELRNKALEILADVGFNKSNPTRLAVGMSATMNWNIGEMYDNYVWARERNLYTVICPTMCSAFKKAWRRTLPDAWELMDLYTEIYKFNIARGLQTLAQIREDGIAAYAGVAPCNQVACGMYVTLNGIVHPCPGDDKLVLGDIRQQSLKEIWENSPNFRRAGKFNCGCPAKTHYSDERCSFAYGFFDHVMRRLEE